MFALVDCNSCYASCEQIFRPELRGKPVVVLSIQVFLNTSPFESGYVNRSVVCQTPFPTNDSRQIVAAALQGLDLIYRPGHRYLKAGVGLLDVCDRAFNQFDLFHQGQSVRSEKMMQVLDKTNLIHGRNSLFVGSEGIVQKWAMRQQYKSPSYTTKWTDIPVVLMG